MAARRRPISFIIFAILNFVMALGFIGCGVCANVTDGGKWHIQINQNRWDEAKLNAHLKEKVPAYTPVKIGGIVTGYLVCAGLILAGVSLLFGGLIGKLSALFIYVCGFVHHAAMIIFQFVFVYPATNQFFDTIPNVIIVGPFGREAARWTTLFPFWVSIAWWVVGILFYIVAALVVGLSSTAGPDDEDDEDSKSKDDDDDDDEDEEDDDLKRKGRERKKRATGIKERRSGIKE